MPHFRTLLMSGRFINSGAAQFFGGFHEADSSSPNRGGAGAVDVLLRVVAGALSGAICLRHVRSTSSQSWAPHGTRCGATCSCRCLPFEQWCMLAKHRPIVSMVFLFSLFTRPLCLKGVFLSDVLVPGSMLGINGILVSWHYSVNFFSNCWRSERRGVADF